MYSSPHEQGERECFRDPSRWAVEEIWSGGVDPPTLASATPALCWNAGITCTDPSANGEMSCSPADIGLDGQVTGPNAAVLRPMSTAYRALRELVEEAGSVGAHAFVLTGVPVDFVAGDPITYFSPSDPSIAIEYGIEPACEVDLHWKKRVAPWRRVRPDLRAQPATTGRLPWRAVSPGRARPARETERFDRPRERAPGS